MRQQTSGCLVLLAVAGCQHAPPPSEAVRAACVSQSYLRTNGFLDTVPTQTIGLTLTEADTRAYADGDDRLDYARLVKDRHNRFTGKLTGVRLADGDTKYTVVYGRKATERRCLGVVSSFAFAFFIAGKCEITQPFVRLREGALDCGR